jgi:hypothetical protein
VSRPYRETSAKLPDVVPDRLECWLRDGDRGKWVRAIYVKLALTAMACWVATSVGAPLASIPLGLIGLLWAYRDWKGRKGASVALVVDKGRLSVRHDDDEFELELAELHDVRLDTKSTKKNVTMARGDGVNTIFGQASNHNIELDVSRIELSLSDDERVILGHDWISHSLCAESLRSIRLFLRAHGWKPLDER